QAPVNPMSSQFEIVLSDVKVEKQRAVAAAAPLRVVPSRLEVEFHPEGGRLIAGVTNRVYYRVRTPVGETVAPDGHVILFSSDDILYDSEREQSAGVFEFVPDPAENYSLRISSPMQMDIDHPFADIGIHKEGVLVRGAGVQSGPIHLTLENV